MRVISRTLLFALTISASLCISAASEAALAEPASIISNDRSELLHTFVLREDIVASQSEEGEAPARLPSDPLNAQDFRGWHTPKARKLIRQLELEYGVQAISMTSHALPTFSAYVSSATLEALSRDVRIAQVIPNPVGAIKFSTWTNRIDGSETVPWGKIAVGTDDALTSSNVVYVVDGGADPAHPDLNVTDAGVNTVVNVRHANHVTGIIGARRNNFLVRGVNPGIAIKSVNRGNTGAEFITAWDWVLADAESRQIFGVANISTNFPNGDPRNAILAQFMRRASNRVLVVQSAGNQHTLACNYAYDAVNYYDGIVIVGGTDADNFQVGPTRGTEYNNTASGYGTLIEPGSNFGICVDVWAPSLNILSTYNTNAPQQMEIMNGTSMAAPHMSGLAARYGTTATRPVERETYLYAKAANTGHLDDGGFEIWIPSYTAPLRYSIPSKLAVSSTTADSTGAGSSTSYASDGLYLNNYWNSGHAAPAWIEFDLGTQRLLASIRLSPEMNPYGNTTHQVYAGNTPNPTTLAATISGYGRTLEPFAASLGWVYGRYVRVVTTASPSWVAWREVEIYGF